jgi:hypothetical protein
VGTIPNGGTIPTINLRALRAPASMSVLVLQDIIEKNRECFWGGGNEQQSERCKKKIVRNLLSCSFPRHCRVQDLGFIIGFKTYCLVPFLDTAGFRV